MTWTLADIRQETRQLTGRLSVTEFSNTMLDQRINWYFQYEFPAEVKLNRNYLLHEFNTTADQQSYDFPADYTNFVPEATLDRRNIEFYQDPNSFYRDNVENVSRFSTWTGDAATVVFSNTYTNQAPLLPGSVVVDDTIEVFSDNGAGVLTGDQGGSGTVTYATGAIAVTFATAPANGQAITASFISYAAGFPRSVLMFDNQFTFFPVPDAAYRFRIKAWSLLLVRPTTGSLKTSFTIPSDRPLQDEWGQAIALGAARRIVVEYGETERYAELTALYKEQINYILTRTHIDLESTRALPMW